MEYLTLNLFDFDINDDSTLIVDEHELSLFVLISISNVISPFDRVWFVASRIESFSIRLSSTFASYLLAWSIFDESLNRFFFV
jgi:hypothetical protein